MTTFPTEEELRKKKDVLFEKFDTIDQARQKLDKFFVEEWGPVGTEHNAEDIDEKKYQEFVKERDRVLKESDIAAKNFNEADDALRSFQKAENKREEEAEEPVSELTVKESQSESTKTEEPQTKEQQTESTATVEDTSKEEPQAEPTTPVEDTQPQEESTQPEGRKHTELGITSGMQDTRESAKGRVHTELGITSGMQSTNKFGNVEHKQMGGSYEDWVKTGDAEPVKSSGDEPSTDVSLEGVSSAQVDAIVKTAATQLAKSFVTLDGLEGAVEQYSKCPESLWDLDETAPVGDTLKIGAGGVGWGTSDSGTGAGLELGSKVCFGYDIDGTTVTIYSGEIDRIAVSETDVTSVANNNYIYVRRTIADDTMLVTRGASVPADDATYKYYKLYQFSVADSVASIKRVWRPFAIEGGLPSNADASQYHVLQISADVGAADDPTKWAIATVKWI